MRQRPVRGDFGFGFAFAMLLLRCRSVPERLLSGDVGNAGGEASPTPEPCPPAVPRNTRSQDTAACRLRLSLSRWPRLEAPVDQARSPTRVARLAALSGAMLGRTDVRRTAWPT